MTKDVKEEFTCFYSFMFTKLGTQETKGKYLFEIFLTFIVELEIISITFNYQYH